MNNPSKMKELIVEAEALMTKKNFYKAVHLLAIGSGAVAALGSAVIVPANEKLMGYAVAVFCILAAQVIHVFCDAIDHKVTLIQAVQLTIPAIEAATAGNQKQTVAVAKVIGQAILDPIEDVPEQTNLTSKDA